MAATHDPPAVLRRQAHGIRAKSITVSLAGSEVDLLRAEAARAGVTPSKRVADLIKLGRQAEEQGAPADNEPTETATS